MNKIVKILLSPRDLAYRIMWRTAKFWPDETYIQMMSLIGSGHKLNLKNPTTFNEKLNWMKLYYHNPQYTDMVDKYKAKDYVASKIGSEYVVPVFGVYRSFEDIDFDKLPNQFVLKCTHDSGSYVVVKNKATMDTAKARKIINRGMNRDYFLIEREWPYKKVEHRILAEKYMDDKTGRTLRDYKFWCFNGKPMYMYCTVKDDDIYENFYDMDFTPVDINHGFRRYQPEFEKPAGFEEMKVLAAKLSEGIPFVRVDFFQVEGTVFFGEFTFYDWAGLQPFERREHDVKLGRLIDLPNQIV